MRAAPGAHLERHGGGVSSSALPQSSANSLEVGDGSFLAVDVGLHHLEGGRPSGFGWSTLAFFVTFGAGCSATGRLALFAAAHSSAQPPRTSGGPSSIERPLSDGSSSARS